MRTTVVILLATFAASGCKRRPFEEDKVVMVKHDDPEMEAAFAAARSKMADFWSRVAKPTAGENGFGVKIPIKDENGTEYVWLTHLSLSDGKVAGTIDNDPDIVKNVKIGQRIEMTRESVVDWLYTRDGKMYGNYTVRPLLKRMDPAEAQLVRARLADP